MRARCDNASGSTACPGSRYQSLPWAYPANKRLFNTIGCSHAANSKRIYPDTFLVLQDGSNTRGRPRISGAMNNQHVWRVMKK